MLLLFASELGRDFPFDTSWYSGCSISKFTSVKCLVNGPLSYRGTYFQDAKVVICIFPNLSFYLWRLCSSESRSDCFCYLCVVIRMFFVSTSFMSISAVAVFSWLSPPYQFKKSLIGCLWYSWYQDILFSVFCSAEFMI